MLVGTDYPIPVDLVAADHLMGVVVVSSPPCLEERLVAAEINAVHDEYDDEVNYSRKMEAREVVLD